jgi:hypothetical protein
MRGEVAPIASGPRGGQTLASATESAIRSDRTWGESFKATYADACAAHLDLVRLPASSLDNLAKNLDDKGRSFMSVVSFLVWGSILLLLFVSPWFGHFGSWSDERQKIVEQWVATRIGPVWRPDWDWRSMTALAVIPILLLVLMWTPLRKKPFASIVLVGMPQSPAPWFNLFSFFFSLMLIAFPVGVARVVLDLRSKTMSAITAGAIAESCFAVVALLLIVLGIAVVGVIIQWLARFLSGIEGDVGMQRLAQEFMELLLRLDRIADLGALTRTERSSLVGKIVGISRRMAQLYEPRADSPTEWATLQMGKASQNMLRLASWLYFPQAGTLDSLKGEMIRYANILLSGNLDELPRGDVGEMEGLRVVVREISGWQRALLHLGMVLWFIAPLAIAGTLISVFHWESRLSGPIEILAGLVYTIWSLWGLVLFVRHLGEDTRTLVIDVFKTVVGRK